MQTLLIVSSVVLVCALVVGSNLLHRGIRSRLRGGRIREVRGSLHILTTDMGSFAIDARQALVRMDLMGKRYTLPFDDISGIAVENTLEWAGLEELMFESFSILDLTGKYRDQRQGYHIQLRTVRGVIPFMSVYQYKVRDLWDWSTPIQLEMLRAMGYYVEVNAYAQDVRQRLLAALQEAGVPREQLRSS